MNNNPEDINGKEMKIDIIPQKSEGLKKETPETYSISEKILEEMRKGVIRILEKENKDGVIVEFPIEIEEKLGRHCINRWGISRNYPSIAQSKRCLQLLYTALNNLDMDQNSQRSWLLFSLFDTCKQVIKTIPPSLSEQHRSNWENEKANKNPALYRDYDFLVNLLTQIIGIDIPIWNKIAVSAKTILLYGMFCELQDLQKGKELKECSFNVQNFLHFDVYFKDSSCKKIIDEHIQNCLQCAKDFEKYIKDKLPIIFLQPK